MYRVKIIQLSLEKTLRKQPSSLLSLPKIVAHENVSPFVINHVSWDRTVCSSAFLCLQQQYQPNHCYKVGLTQTYICPKSHVPQGASKKKLIKSLPQVLHLY